jgi:isocitrate lyase
LVPVSEHINRLIAIRLQYDIMGVENLSVCRTDAEAATLLSSNIDPRDHPFVIGSTNASIGHLADEMNKAELAGANGAKLQAVEDNWIKVAGLCLYSDAVVAAAKAKNVSAAKIAEFVAKAASASHAVASGLAKTLVGSEVYWDWTTPRTREGYYRYQGGTQCAINRAVAFAPYCDLLWMETKSPILAQAQEFANGVKAVYPNKWLAYNLSPSFNWSAAGLNEAQMKSYVWELGQLGFVWQFITVSLTFYISLGSCTDILLPLQLAGLHSNAYVSDLFAKAFAVDGMKAYVNLIQSKEKEIGCEVLTHQKVRPLPPLFPLTVY